jgi:hypothetical protein
MNEELIVRIAAEVVRDYERARERNPKLSRRGFVEGSWKVIIDRHPALAPDKHRMFELTGGH